MSKRGGNPKKPPEEEEWKKKKKFDDDPIVKRYTGGAYQSFKARSEEELKKKKKSDEQIDKRPGTDFGYRPESKDDDFKKTRKNVSGILDDMFGAKETVPFANVQYTNKTKHIQRGEHHKHRRGSRGHSKDRKEHSVQATGSATKVTEMPTFEKKKKKFDQNELFKKKEPESAAVHPKIDGKLISMRVVISKRFVNTFLKFFNLPGCKL